MGLAVSWPESWRPWRLLAVFCVLEAVEGVLYSLDVLDGVRCAVL